MDLPTNVDARFNRLCDDAESLMNDEKYDAALTILNSAYELLPEPREQWNVAVWVLGARAHCYFHQKDFEACRRETTQALSSSADPDSAIAYMRLGQCELELGNLDGAATALERAYKLGGAEMFIVEDSKYFEFLQAQRPAPAGGWY